MTIVNFGRQCHLSLDRVVSDDDYSRQVAWWLNGRVLGLYVSWAWKTLR